MSQDQDLHKKNVPFITRPHFKQFKNSHFLNIVFKFIFHFKLKLPKFTQEIAKFVSSSWLIRENRKLT